MAIGEEKVWQTLMELTPEEVCRRTDATFEETSGLYVLKSFGMDFSIFPREKRTFGNSKDSEALFKKIGFFFRMSAVGYLVMAKDVSSSGRLVNPVNMTSGQLFFRGSHVLPLDKVAVRYGNDREGFLQKGIELGAEKLDFGDASFRLLPLPRVPVVIILWLEDEEFPPRADLLFDSSSEIQMPIDVIWSIAMLCSIALL